MLEIPRATEPGADSVDLGVLDFRPGARLKGSVVRPSGEGVQAEVRIRKIEPSGWQGDPSDPVQAPGVWAVSTSAEGLFGLESLPLGSFVLEASSGALDMASTRIRLVEEGEEQLEPLVLRARTVPTLALDPPVDPSGEAWAIRLGIDEGNRVRSVSTGRTDPSGSWTGPVIEAGSYSLQITDSRDQTWYREPIELFAGEDFQVIEIPHVPVIGHLRFGDEPMAGELVFGTGQGAVRIRMRQEEGASSFSGILPREGLWPIEIRLLDQDPDFYQAAEPVEVKRHSGQLRARVEIRLPPTRITGRVTAGGEPVADASVLLVRPDARRRDGLRRTDEDGRFQFFGLGEGSVTLQAFEDRGRSSGLLELEIVEDQPRELQIELVERLELQGQVVDIQGQPIPGAEIRAWPKDSSGMEIDQVRRATSGMAGEVLLDIPETAAVVDLLVWSPGHALGLNRVAVADGPVLLHLLPVSASGRIRVDYDLEKAGGLRLRHLDDWGEWRIGRAFLESRSISVSEEGTLLLSGLPPGGYSLCDTDCVSGQLVSAAELSLDLEQRQP
jgi:hypothetical protein